MNECRNQPSEPMAKDPDLDLEQPILAPMMACGGLVAPYRVGREELVFPEPQTASAGKAQAESVTAEDQ